MKRILAILLSLALLLAALPGGAFAAGSTVSISTAEEFITFARDCTLDSYSQEKTFQLTADIDLTGQEFSSVPLFCGTFEGNGHTISGLSLTGDGSHQGLFRYVAEGAQIKNLTVNGTVTPGGTGCAVGGIAGSNSGTLLGCQFTGTISGVEQVGGIAGENTPTGVITSCAFSGSLTGEHQVGGIAGSNQGVLLGCRNDGEINTVPVSATTNTTFDISSLSEEDFISVIHIGGIAGISSGVIQSCENRGNVGYEHLGYNVGGIAGTTSGYLFACTNSGTVLGRRDVGGIAGQLEPYAVWDLSDSKLEDLEDQLGQLTRSVTSAAEHISAHTSALTGELQSMLDYTNSAANALGDILNDVTSGADSIYTAVSDAANLLESEAKKAADSIRDTIDSIRPEETPAEEPPVPDGQETEESEPQPAESETPTPPEEEAPNTQPEKTLSAEKLRELSNQLRDILSQIEVNTPDAAPLLKALDGVYRSASALGSAFEGTASALSDEIGGIMNQVDSVFGTISETAESIGAIDPDYQTDLSVSRAYDQDTGAVGQCVNYGSVQADNNAGGITGSVAFEISFDMEDELNLSDYLFTNIKYLIFAVLRDCESYGDITAKKECAGGIVGDLSYGAVINCTGIGSIAVEQGNYAGGIAGRADGSIVTSATRAALSGTAYVGGIVGLGADLSGCLSYSSVDSGSEYLGAIAGWTEGTVTENQYVDSGLGAIDGVSYAGKAEPISYEAMLARSDLPAAFETITVTFVAEGKTVEVVEVPFGGSIDTLPEVPNDGDQYWKWDDFSQDNIYYSIVVEGKYYNPRSTISTGEEFPLFLAEGTFYEGQTLTAVPYTPDYEALGVAEEDVISAYTLLVSDYTEPLTVRMKAEEPGTLYQANGDGTYSQVSYRTDGGYLVFSLENGGSVVYVRKAVSRLPYYLGGGAGVLLLGGAVAVVLLRRRKKKGAAAESAPSDET